MQVMGQVARESGFDALFLSALCDPEQGLAVGCKLLRKKFDLVGADTTRALLAWNGGANPTRFKFSRAARITYKPRRERSTFFSLCSGAASCATTSMAIGK
jgi:soluble lytic murein transglycosylase-like protein